MMEEAELARQERQAEQLQKTWDEVDEDGSGNLDADELKKVLLRMGRSDTIDEVMKEIDKNGTGRWSQIPKSNPARSFVIQNLVKCCQSHLTAEQLNSTTCTRSINLTVY